jgi:hypothetical protein
MAFPFLLPSKLKSPPSTIHQLLSEKKVELEKRKEKQEGREIILEIKVQLQNLTGSYTQILPKGFTQSQLLLITS